MPNSLNVHKLSEKLNLSSNQEDLVKLLVKADGFQLNAEYCRSKLKALNPTNAKTLSAEMKKLETKGVILIGYDVSGTKFVKLSPDNELDQIMNSEKESTQNRAKKLTMEETRTIMDEIVSFISSKKDICVDTDDISAHINSFVGEPLTANQIKTVLQNMEYNKKIIYRKRMKKGETVNERRVAYKLQPDNVPDVYSSPLPTESSLEAVKEDDENKIVIGITPNDMESISTALTSFKIYKHPKDWVKGVVEDIILNLSERKLFLTDLTFDDEFMLKYQWLREDFQDKDKMQIESTIHHILNDFIDGEYNKRCVFNQFHEIITHSTDPKILGNIKSLIDRRMRDLTNTPGNHA
jgi:hypothetical protein